MSRSIARTASVTALAVVAALCATTALAGNGNGKDHGNSAGAPGVKPGNSTQHWTTCTTGGGTGTSATCTSSNANTTNADASKRYGSGKTAAQIANSRGAPAGTVLTGPGNSQPHKVAVCPGKTNKSGGKDVHAVKSYSTASCAPPASSPAVAVSVSASMASSSSVSQSKAVQSKQSPAVVSEKTATASEQTFAQSSAPTSAQSVAATRAPTSTPGAESGVLGAVKALSSPPSSSSSPHATGGVLGVLGKLSVLGGNLPFSGFPLWAAMLVALALLAFGLVVRRRAAATH